MKITRTEAWAVDLKLSEPYEIAYETVDQVQNVFVRVETNERTVGYGCAAPDLAVTGETAQSVLDAWKNVVEPALHLREPLRHREKPANDKQPGNCVGSEDVRKRPQ